MADELILTVTPDTTAPFVLTNGSTPPFVLTTLGSSPVTLQMGASLAGLVDLTGPKGDPAPKFVSFYVSGTPLDDEVIAAAPVPYDVTLTPSKCLVEAVIAAEADTVFDIYAGDDGTEHIGTITFLAGERTGTVVFTRATILKGEFFKVQTPALSDATLADIGFLLA